MPETRRVVCVNDAEGRGTAIQDGPTPDARTDPARPGYSLARIWVSDSAPARIRGVRETLFDLPHCLEPPERGSVCRIETIPPDSVWRSSVSEKAVREFFSSVGSPSASTYTPEQPYMHRTSTLDFCLILDGEVTLVLDTEEVNLQAGDTVIQRGTNHAWRNRINRPCVIAISSHAGAY
jgi:mannose-6-phosphate isomerase-like protein (cupin superfamily)